MRILTLDELYDIAKRLGIVCSQSVLPLDNAYTNDNYTTIEVELYIMREGLNGMGKRGIKATSITRNGVIVEFLDWHLYGDVMGNLFVNLMNYLNGFSDINPAASGGSNTGTNVGYRVDISDFNID
jgi:hypothetical protein